MAEQADAYRGLLTDLAAEQIDLDTIVTPLSNEDGDRPTPAEGWSVRDQIGHLYYFDGAATLSIVDPPAFEAEREALTAAVANSGSMDHHTLAFARGAVPGELLSAWRQGRQELLDALDPLDPKARLEWYGPSMSAMSFATARLMETWAHGQDIVDTLGIERQPTDRLRHIADLGFRTRAFAYVIRGLDPPTDDVRLELNAPSGGTWSWGDKNAEDRVSGDALDFCLVVTQRRHYLDTGLTADGQLAQGWLEIAQAFAGAATPGRPPHPNLG